MPTAASKKPATPTRTKPVSKPAPKGDSPFEDNFDASLADLFKSELKDLYWAEIHLVAAIPKMIDAAKGAELKRALTKHLEETKKHVTRLENVFGIAQVPVLPKKCDAMEGLTMSGEHVIENTLPGSPGREAGLIGSGIKVEQFEITSYNGLIQLANKLGLSEAVPFLQQNLDEEIAASDTLNRLNGMGQK